MHIHSWSWLWCVHSSDGNEAAEEELLTTPSYGADVSLDALHTVSHCPLCHSRTALLQWVCLSLCLSSRISWKPHVWTSSYFLLLWLGPFLATFRIMRPVLPVLWMTSRFPIMGPVAAWRYRSSYTGVLCTGYHPFCMVLVAFCPRRRRAPRLDESLAPGVLQQCAMHRCLGYSRSRQPCSLLITTVEITL